MKKSTVYQKVITELDSLNAAQTKKLRALIVLHKTMKALTIEDLDNILEEIDNRSCLDKSSVNLTDIVVED